MLFPSFHSVFFYCRRTTVPMQLGRLRKEIRQVGRIGEAHADAHRRKEFRMPRLQQKIHAERPP